MKLEESKIVTKPKRKRVTEPQVDATEEESEEEEAGEFDEEIKNSRNTSVKLRAKDRELLEKELEA